MKNQWITITISSLVSVTAIQNETTQEKETEFLKTIRKISAIKKDDLIAMMEKSDCRCYARKKNSSFDNPTTSVNNVSTN